MAKYILRLASILVIVFISVPMVVSKNYTHTYSLPLDPYGTVLLHMPNGSQRSVSSEEYFSGAAAAYFPDENNEDILSAFCIMLNTPELTEHGIYYLSPSERSALFGNKYDEKCELYSKIWESVSDKHLILPDDVILPLSEYACALEHCSGSYTDRLSVLFPGGGLKTIS